MHVMPLLLVSCLLSRGAAYLVGCEYCELVGASSFRWHQTHCPIGSVNCVLAHEELWLQMHWRNPPAWNQGVFFSVQCPSWSLLLGQNAFTVWQKWFVGSQSFQVSACLSKIDYGGFKTDYFIELCSLGRSMSTNATCVLEVDPEVFFID